MTSTNVQTFPGEVVINGKLTVSSGLTGDGSAIENIQSSNVTDFASNVSRITNLETTDMTIGGEKTFSSNLEVGTANLFVDTTTGNVGIGTATPAYELDVVGNVNFTGSLYQNGTEFVGGGSSIWIQTGNDAYYNTGNVGIGTATPAYELDVVGNVSANYFISEYLTTSNITAYSATNNTPPQQTQVITKYDTSSNPISSGYVQDTSGQNLDGQIVGTVTYNSTDKSLDFSGTNSYTQVFFDGSGLNNAHTISLWVKLNGTPNNYAAIFAIGDRYTGADNGEVSLFWNNGTQDFYYSFIGGTGSNDDNLYATPDPLINTWYNIVLTYDGNTKKFYVNGVLNSTSTTTVCNIPSTNCVLRLNGDAANSNSTHQSQPTSISNFKLYDVALTTNEVSTLYSFGRNGETATSTGIINFSNTNVGIGTATPAYNLDVTGDINFTGSLYQNGVAFSGGGGGSSVWTQSGNDVYYNTGNVGIGIVSPSFKLHVNGMSRFENEMMWSGTGNMSHANYSTNRDWYIRSGSSSGKVVIQDTGGNTGVGTSNPGCKLDVNGVIRNQNPAFYAQKTTSVTGPNVIVWNSEKHDRTNNYDTTNGRFTAPISGYYFFSFYALSSNSVTCWYYIKKNGILVHNAQPYQRALGDMAQVSASIILDLAVNDYVEIYINSGTMYGGGNDHNGFCGYLIG
jgi:hypothetical protein